MSSRCKRIVLSAIMDSNKRGDSANNKKSNDGDLLSNTNNNISIEDMILLGENLNPLLSESFIEAHGNISLDIDETSSPNFTGK